MSVQCLAHTAHVTIILQATSLGSVFEPSSGLIHEQDADNFIIAIFRLSLLFTLKYFTHTHIYIYI
jgi:hypothetical protein